MTVRLIGFGLLEDEAGRLELGARLVLSHLALAHVLETKGSLGHQKRGVLGRTRAYYLFPRVTVARGRDR